MNTTIPHCISELVSTFSVVERRMLMLHWADEMTPREIEMVLDLPRDTVAETLAGIKDRIGQALNDSPGDIRAA